VGLWGSGLHLRPLIICHISACFGFGREEEGLGDLHVHIEKEMQRLLGSPAGGFPEHGMQPSASQKQVYTLKIEPCFINICHQRYVNSYTASNSAKCKKLMPTLQEDPRQGYACKLATIIAVHDECCICLRSMCTLMLTYG
jgi:hypothetical protein